MFTYTIGAVDEVDGKNIQTQFVAFIGPLFPVKSMYVERQTVARRGNASVVTTEGIPIDFYWKSVLLGYLRVWLAVGLFVYPFASHWGQGVHFGWESPWIEELVILAALVGSMFFGKLSKDEKAKRRVLGSVTGLKLHPRHLSHMTREIRRDELAELVKKIGLSTDDPKACLDALAGCKEDVAPVYAYAMYSAPREPAWKAVADATWPKVASQGNG